MIRRKEKKKKLMRHEIERIVQMVVQKSTNDDGTSGPGAIYDKLPFPELSKIPVRRNDASKRFRLVTKFLKKYLNIDWKDKVVLDIGCAAGGISFRLYLAGVKSVIGIDYDRESIQIAQEISRLKEIKNTHFIYTTLDKYVSTTDKDQFYDIVICLSVFHWLLKEYGEEQLKNYFIKLFNDKQIVIYEGSKSEKPSHNANFTNAVDPEWIKQFWSEVGFNRFKFVGNLSLRIDRSFKSFFKPKRMRPIWIIWKE